MTKRINNFSNNLCIHIYLLVHENFQMIRFLTFHLKIFLFPLEQRINQTLIQENNNPPRTVIFIKKSYRLLFIVKHQ